MIGALTFAVILPGLWAAHEVGDYWAQTSHQAATKGLEGWAGRKACAQHVATYTAVTAGVVCGLWWVFGLDIGVWGFLAGQSVSAVTHYWADRRFTLARLCDRIGLGGFYRTGQPRKVRAFTTDGAEVFLHLNNTNGSAKYRAPWDNPSMGTGALLLDQSWHKWWLFVAAILTAVI